MKFLQLGGLFVLLAIVGCKNNRQKEETKKEITVLRSSVSDILKGKLIIGNEVSSFKPCGDSLVYWLNDENTKLTKLYNKAAKGEKPYTELYCEIEAEKEPNTQDGFSAEYDGVLRVKKVIKVEPITLENNCK